MKEHILTFTLRQVQGRALSKWRERCKAGPRGVRLAYGLTTHCRKASSVKRTLERELSRRAKAARGTDRRARPYRSYLGIGQALQWLREEMERGE